MVKAAKPDMPRLYSVGQAIFIARSVYQNTKYASHPIIEECENWLNSHRVRPSEVTSEMKAGRLRRCETSGYLYIQVASSS